MVYNLSKLTVEGLVNGQVPTQGFQIRRGFINVHKISHPDGPDMEPLFINFCSFRLGHINF